MFEHCEVEVRFSGDGQPRPTIVVWDGKRLPVVDVGRHWQAGDGLHRLVVVADGRGFELWYDSGTWHARTGRQRPTTSFCLC